MIVPKEAFLSACKASEVFFVGRQLLDRDFQFLDRQRPAIESDGVIRIHADDGVLLLRGRFRRRLRFRAD